jgi:hypothetical protein
MMATRDDVRRIALSLPATEKAVDRFAFSVRKKGKLKGFVWVWMERVVPKKPRVPNPGVIAVRVASLDERARLIAADPKKFFTEPHYEGFPAVLVRLDEVSVKDLERLIPEAWRCQASIDLVKAQTPEADTRRRGARTRRSTSRPATGRAGRRGR